MSFASIFTSKDFREALGCFPTGVAIITAPDDLGGYVGVTVNSFTSVSLDPPLVLWSLARDSYSRQAFVSAGWFAINILAAGQVELSKRFATRQLDKFAGVVVERGLGGVALFDGCSARFQCRTYAVHDGGDHLIFIGEVIDFDYRGRDPLVFHRGRYVEAGPPPPSEQ